MLDDIKRLPMRAAQELCSFLGMSFCTAEATLTAVHLKPDDKGGWVKAKHPNKLKALLGFHDVRVEHKVITDAFVADIVDCLTATSVRLALFDDYKYHDSGIGTGAEAAGDTALGTPWGGARDVGTQIEGATANIYKSVATTSYNATKAITEHGLFNASSSVTLMDRTVFAAINVVSGDGIQWTYQITFTSGG